MNMVTKLGFGGFAMIGILSLLSGCATVTGPRDDTVASSRTFVESAVACCNGYASLPYERFTGTNELVFDIEKSSPVFAFPRGKSHFRAFELPEVDRAYTIEVDSQIAGPGFTVWSGWMFYPVVMFLDERYAPIEIIRDLPYEFNSRSWLDSYGMAASVKVEKDKGAKYLVVFTEPEYLNYAFTFHAYGRIGAGRVISLPATDSKYVPFGYEGRVGIKLNEIDRSN